MMTSVRDRLGSMGGMGRALRFARSAAILLLLGGSPWAYAQDSIQSVDYYPLARGNTWVFDNGATYTVGNSPRVVNGMTFYPIRLSAPGVSGTTYAANDAQGFVSSTISVAAGTLQIENAYSPPFPTLAGTMRRGETYYSNGSTTMDVQYSGREVSLDGLMYSSFTKYTGTERITLALGSFDCAVVEGETRIYGNAYGIDIDQTEGFKFWLAKGIGPIRMRNSTLNRYVNLQSYTVASATSNGACGTAQGVASASAPETGLCASGTASAVSGTGPWSWQCAGSNGGAAAACTAEFAAPTPAVPGMAGSGSSNGYSLQGRGEGTRQQASVMADVSSSLIFSLRRNVYVWANVPGYGVFCNEGSAGWVARAGNALCTAHSSIAPSKSSPATVTLLSGMDISSAMFANTKLYMSIGDNVHGGLVFTVQ